MPTRDIYHRASGSAYREARAVRWEADRRPGVWFGQSESKVPVRHSGWGAGWDLGSRDQDSVLTMRCI